MIIVGGGLNGPALALALAGAGISSVVIDALSEARRAEDRFDGRAYAMALASVRALDALGLWEGLEDHAQPILAVKAAGGRPGQGASPFVLGFDHAEIEEGPLGYMIEDRFLRRALLAAMAGTGLVTHLAGEAAVAQSAGPAGVEVALASGASVSGRLLVGADGRGSATAERAGIRRQGWDYGQTALVCAVDHERPHHGTAYQIFLPGGPLAVLPLPGNRSSIVWSERRPAAEALAAAQDDAFLAALRPVFGDFLGEIALAGDRYSYPLSLTLAERMVADRLALVGDAAHGVHPIAGQGLNLGLRDVGALAEVLVEAARRGEDIGAGDVLERYARWRRFDTVSLALGMDAVNRLFCTDNPVLGLARDLGIGAVGQVPALRRLFMREAAGLSGDLPRLLRGEPV